MLDNLHPNINKCLDSNSFLSRQIKHRSALTESYPNCPSIWLEYDNIFFKGEGCTQRIQNLITTRHYAHHKRASHCAHYSQEREICTSWENKEKRKCTAETLAIQPWQALIAPARGEKANLLLLIIYLLASLKWCFTQLHLEQPSSSFSIHCSQKAKQPHVPLPSIFLFFEYIATWRVHTGSEGAWVISPGNKITMGHFWKLVSQGFVSNIVIIEVVVKNW